MTNFQKVKEFMLACDQEVLETPTFPSPQIRELRQKLISEEFIEFVEANRSEDIVAVADALSDLLYVIYGAGHSYGIDLDACFAEVHRSNMTKVGSDGKVIRRYDGKILKPESYEPPNLKKIVQGA